MKRDIMECPSEISNSKKSINFEIKSLIKKAKNYANKRGYSQFADDFAQEVYISCRGTIRTSFSNLFTDFLRKEFGDTRIPSGKLKSGARHRGVPFDGLRPGLCDRALSYADTLASPGGNAGFEQSSWGNYLNFQRGRWNSLSKQGLYEEVFQMLFIKELPEAEIGDCLGVTESRISQLKNSIKESIKSAMCLDEIWDSYHYDKDSSKMIVDWISL